MTEMQVNEIDSADYASVAHAIRQSARTFAGWYGREWANQYILTPLGIENLGTRERSEYRINIAITGNYGRRVSATSRKEALAEFFKYLQATLGKGKITADGSYDNVYRVALVEGAEPVFYSGPEDPEDLAANRPATVADLKARYREILMALRLADGSNVPAETYNAELKNLGLDPLPPVQTYTVQVPVAGTTTLTVRGYDETSALEGMGAQLAHGVTLTPDAVGPATLTVTSGAGTPSSTPDEDDDDDEDSDGEDDEY